jgi:hypothetical protein
VATVHVNARPEAARPLLFRASHAVSPRWSPCTSLEGGEEGAAYLFSARNGALIGSYPGRDEDGRLGLDVALLRTAVALAGRGPDTADNGIVRLVPR